MNSFKFSYRLDEVCQILINYHYQSIVLQFSDEYLVDCIEIYNYIFEAISSDILQCPSIFLACDSTFGVAADDVAAMHVNGDVVVYFGSDYSCTASIPLIIVQKQRDLRNELIKDFISLQILKVDTTKSNGNVNAHKVLVLYEPCYSVSLDSLFSVCDEEMKGRVYFANLPAPGNLKQWHTSLPYRNDKATHTSVDGPTSQTVHSISASNSSATLGSLVLPKEIQIETNHIRDCIVLYIGNKSEQIINITTRISQQEVICLNPEDSTVQIRHGEKSREFHERYVNIIRVGEAKVIGLLVASMGLSQDISQNVIHRLTLLIDASGKKPIVVIMGKLNESKLCNFPEVDVFCLICNEDTAMIRPKTFPVPIVTPWELEIGLQGRLWEGSYNLDVKLLLGDGSESLQIALDRIKRVKADDDDDEVYDDQLRLVSTMTGVVSSTIGVVDEAVVVRNMASQVANINHNELLDRFQSREYRGLVHDGEGSESTAIRSGQHGIASRYTTSSR